MEHSNRVLYTRMCIIVCQNIEGIKQGLSKKDAVANTFYEIEDVLNTKAAFICSEFVEQYKGSSDKESVIVALKNHIYSVMKGDNT